MGSAAPVKLVVHAADNRVAVDVHNATREVIAVATHARYFLVELLDARGQFIRGTNTAMSMPSSGDFVEVAKQTTAERAIEFDVTRDGDAVTIGTWSFPKAPAKITARVTYKSDPVVPNLPSKMRRAFYRGPVVSERFEIPTISRS